MDVVKEKPIHFILSLSTLELKRFAKLAGILPLDFELVDQVNYWEIESVVRGLKEGHGLIRNQYEYARKLFVAWNFARRAVNINKRTTLLDDFLAGKRIYIQNYR